MSASASHVPFEPSVHTRWCTTQPAAAHLASVRTARRTRRRRGGRRSRARRAAPGRSTVTAAWSLAGAGWPGSLALTSALRAMSMPARRNAAATAGWRQSSIVSTSIDEVRVGARRSTAAPRGERGGEVPCEAAARRTRRRARRAHGRLSTLVPSRRRSGTSTIAARTRHGEAGRGSGRSPWATTTWSKPLPAIVATPWSTAPLRPRPGPHSTVGAARLGPRGDRRRRRRRRTSGAGRRRRARRRPSSAPGAARRRRRRTAPAGAWRRRTTSPGRAPPSARRRHYWSRPRSQPPAGILAGRAWRVRSSACRVRRRSGWP